ncbi:hypothetical protein Q7P36_004646 [Cladosporium allicinum]
MTTTVRHNYTPQPEEAPSHVSILPYIPITLAAFIFSFALAIHQPPGPRRWACLPTVLAGPALHTFAISRGLSPSFLLWIWTFTVVIWTTHATAVLYIENSVVTRPFAGGWNWLAVCKGWNNPRRIPMTAAGPGSASRSPLSVLDRASFALNQILFVLLTGTMWIAGHIFSFYILRLRPKDFDPPTYIYIGADRTALLRILVVLQWMSSSYFLLTAAHAAVSIVFVALLGLDSPDEWPPPLGRHPQCSIAKFGPRYRSPIGKTLTSLCVFCLSGLTHAAANYAAYGGRRRAAPILLGDATFLLLNFAGGFVEVWFAKLIDVRRLDAGVHVPWLRTFGQYFGYAWLLFFFYCVVPPYQYPFLKEMLKVFIPDIRFNIQQGPIQI